MGGEGSCIMDTHAKGEKRGMERLWRHGEEEEIEDGLVEEGGKERKITKLQ